MVGGGEDDSAALRYTAPMIAGDDAQLCLGLPLETAVETLDVALHAGLSRLGWTVEEVQAAQFDALQREVLARVSGAAEVLVVSLFVEMGSVVLVGNDALDFEWLGDLLAGQLECGLRLHATRSREKLKQWNNGGKVAHLAADRRWHDGGLRTWRLFRPAPVALSAEAAPKLAMMNTKRTPAMTELDAHFIALAHREGRWAATLDVPGEARLEVHFEFTGDDDAALASMAVDVAMRRLSGQSFSDSLLNRRHPVDANLSAELAAKLGEGVQLTSWTRLGPSSFGMTDRRQFDLQLRWNGEAVALSVLASTNWKFLETIAQEVNAELARRRHEAEQKVADAHHALLLASVKAGDLDAATGAYLDLHAGYFAARPNARDEARRKVEELMKVRKA
jgi:hypothetical protein